MSNYKKVQISIRCARIFVRGGVDFMEDKSFELLTKIYSEMQDGFKDVRQDIVRLENKMDDNLKALYDGYKQSVEGINELKEEFQNLSDKVEHQEIKLQVMKGTR